MNEKRREILLGYVLGALEPHEKQKVEQELECNDSLRLDLADLSQEVAPVMAACCRHVAPTGLAEKTCKNLWEKINSKEKHLQKSNELTLEQPISEEKLARPHFSDAFRTSTSLSKHRKITAVFGEMPLTNPAEVKQEQQETSLTHADNHAAIMQAPDTPVSEVSPTITISPNYKNSQKEHREKKPAGENVSTLMAETPSMMMITKHHPRYYGKSSPASATEPTHKRGWKKRDLFASLLVGITAAVLLYPVIQAGMGNLREMIFQKKVREFSQSIPAGSSPYSAYGISANDLMLVNSMNIDSNSAIRFQQLHQDNKFKNLLNQLSGISNDPNSPVQPIIITSADQNQSLFGATENMTSPVTAQFSPGIQNVFDSSNNSPDKISSLQPNGGAIIPAAALTIPKN